MPLIRQKKRYQPNHAGLYVPAPGGGGFDPLTLFSGGAAGLWLDPSDSSTVWQNSALSTPAVSGDPLGGISDKSGNGNHATQATSGLRPTLTNASGKWYFQTDGSDDFLRSTFTLAQPWYRISAIHVVTVTGNDQFFGGVTANAGVLFDFSNNFQMYSGSFGPSSTKSTATNYVITEYFNGSSSIIRKDGVQQGGTADPGSTAPGGVTIGADNSGAGTVSMRCYGLIITTKALSGTEITDAETYLTGKF